MGPRSHQAPSIAVTATQPVAQNHIAIIHQPQPVAHQIPEWVGPLVSLIAAVLAVGVAWLSLRTNAAVNLRNKRMDVISSCNARYDDLYKSRIEIERKGKAGDDITFETRAYFRRFWGLKSDQLDYWLAGYVDPETVASWFASITDKPGDDGHLAGQTLAVNWKSELRELHLVINDRLVGLVDFLIDNQQYLAKVEVRFAALLQYLRILETSDYVFIRRLAKNDHRRFIVSRLVDTLSRDDRGIYDQLDTAPWWVAGWHLLRRTDAAIVRGFQRIVFGRAEQRLETLRTKLACETFNANEPKNSSVVDWGSN